MLGICYERLNVKITMEDGNSSTRPALNGSILVLKTIITYYHLFMQKYETSMYLADFGLKRRSVWTVFEGYCPRFVVVNRRSRFFKHPLRIIENT